MYRCHPINFTPLGVPSNFYPPQTFTPDDFYPLLEQYHLLCFIRFLVKTTFTPHDSIFINYKTVASYCPFWPRRLSLAIRKLFGMLYQILDSSDFTSSPRLQSHTWTPMWKCENDCSINALFAWGQNECKSAVETRKFKMSYPRGRRGGGEKRLLHRPLLPYSIGTPERDFQKKKFLKLIFYFSKIPPLPGRSRRDRNVRDRARYNTIISNGRLAPSPLFHHTPCHERKVGWRLVAHAEKSFAGYYPLGPIRPRTDA